MKKVRDDYYELIRSPEWRELHPKWLKLCRNRCCIYPWRRLGRVDRHYFRYAMHHMNYGGNRIFWSVIPISKKAHDDLIHGLLGGYRSAGKQRGYPNFEQRLIHAWARLVFLILVLSR